MVGVSVQVGFAQNIANGKKTDDEEEGPQD